MLGACAFETERLLAREWHSLSPAEWNERDLADVVAQMLTEPVTRSLPEPWHGRYSLDRAGAWVEERDEEGTTLLVIEKSSREPVGLVLLFETTTGDDTHGIDVRLGYLLSEASWGAGFASELVAGLVLWCRAYPVISSITGGVNPDNRASKRVLEKNGFLPVGKSGAESPEEFYRLSL